MYICTQQQLLHYVCILVNDCELCTYVLALCGEVSLYRYVCIASLEELEVHEEIQ